MRKLKIGIIGCGAISPMHAVPVGLYKNAELAAVCDIKKDRADRAAARYGARAYGDYIEMLEKERPDAVHVCLPHYLHTVVSKDALLRGVNVLCEKPMSIALKDAEANVKLAEEKKLLYGIIFQCRYNTASQFVKRNLDNGRLGKVISARSVLTWNKPDSYYAASDWKGTWEKEGGGVIIDQAIHSIDLVNWFIGDEPVSIAANLSNRNHPKAEVEDTGEGLIKYKNGAVYGFYAMNTYGCDEPIEIRLYCEKGKAVLSYEAAQITFNDGKTESVVQDMSDAADYGAGAKDYWGFQHIKQIHNFYDCLLNGKRPDIDGEEALKVQRIAEGIYGGAAGPIRRR
ncbi:oxidoreductase [Clostridia bacterium]|nr:oxidoreductase [Clostridia bacterium]